MYQYPFINVIGNEYDFMSLNEMEFCYLIKEKWNKHSQVIILPLTDPHFSSRKMEFCLTDSQKCQNEVQTLGQLLFILINSILA
jgi:uncharacterized protein with WD repeat